MKTHASSLDRTSMLVTLGVVILAVIVIYNGWANYHKSAGAQLELSYLLITIILFAALILGTFLFRTTSISTNGEAISIHRPVNTVTIPYSDIRSIMPLTKTDMGLVVRTFGNGGMFGYTGMFYNKRHGAMRWYCTNRMHYILIEKNNGKKLVLSPDNPNELIQNLRTSGPGLKFSYPEESY